MKDLWKIARWEIMRNITNKQFLVGLLITPLIMGLFAVVPFLLERWNTPATSTYYVVDELEALPSLQVVLPSNIILTEYADANSVENAVKEASASGYLILDQDFLTTGQIDLMYNDRNMEGVATVRNALTTVLQQMRLTNSDVSQEEVGFVTAPAQVRQVPMEDDLEPQTMHMVVSIVFTILIFMLIFTSGTMLMQSASQEKRDRMAEVILSSIRPKQLMQGKIVGHFLLGIIQLGFWLAIGLPIARYFLDFPIMEALGAVNLPIILFFGFGGYFLFSALFVSLGATMEDMQSAGNSQGLVIMLPMLSFLFLGPVMSNPDGTISIFASLFPFTSSMIMMIRSGVTVVPLWQTLSAAAILLATAYAATLMATKIFRVGMLMYGKNATPQEIMKWLRYKES